jgi:hypothetical protein
MQRANPTNISPFLSSGLSARNAHASPSFIDVSTVIEKRVGEGELP